MSIQLRNPGRQVRHIQVVVAGDVRKVSLPAGGSITCDALTSGTQALVASKQLIATVIAQVAPLPVMSANTPAPVAAVPAVSESSVISPPDVEPVVTPTHGHARRANKSSAAYNNND